MAQRLDWIKQAPEHWANWRALPSGAATHGLVHKKYPKSKPFLAPAHTEQGLIALKLIANQDKTKAWFAKLTGNSAAMTRRMPDGLVNMVWANMSLHTEPDPAETVRQWHGMLKVDGYLMFSCLGPDTATELRHIYNEMGWPPAAHPLTDMHDWGDLLVRSGFAEPVMDMERIVLTFATPERALQELRSLGRNLHPARHAGLRGKSWHKRLLTLMRERLANAQGQIELSFEIIYGHAFKPAPRVQLSAQSSISIDEMRTMLAQGRRR